MPECVGIEEPFVSCLGVSRRKIAAGIRSARGSIHENEGCLIPLC